MSFIDNIRKQPQATKIRIMWAVAIGVVVLLIMVWVISIRFNKNVPKDTTLFQTIGSGIKDVKDNFHK